MKHRRSRKQMVMFMVMLLMVIAIGTMSYAANVAAVGNRKFSSLEDAIHFAKNGQTVRLLKNITTKKQIYISKAEKITIDFAGKKYRYAASSGAAFSVMRINGMKGITLKNANIVTSQEALWNQGKAVLSGGTWKGGYITNSGTMTISKGTYSMKGTKKKGLLFNIGVLKIKGGTFTQTGGSVALLFNDIGGRCEISGGSFTGKTAYVLDNCGKITVQKGKMISTREGTIWNREKATMNIKGGTFQCKAGDNNYAWVASNFGNMTISDGTFSGSICNDTKKTERLLINGGTFRSEQTSVTVANYGGGVNITGGIFSATRNHTIRNHSGATMTITGGSFITKSKEGAYALYNEGGSVSVTGGTFKSNGSVKRSIGCTASAQWWVTGSARGNVVTVED